MSVFVGVYKWYICLELIVVIVYLYYYYDIRGEICLILLNIV